MLRMKNGRMNTVVYGSNGNDAVFNVDILSIIYLPEKTPS